MTEGKEIHIPLDISERIREEINDVYIFYYSEASGILDDMYFVGKPSSKQYHGFCTSCGGWVALNCKPKHNEKAVCPMCFREATLKAGGRGRKSIKDNNFIRAFSKEADGSVRLYEIVDHREDFTDYEYELAPRCEYMYVERLHVITAGGWETYRTNGEKMKKPGFTSDYVAYGVTMNGYTSRSMRFLDEELGDTCLKHIVRLISDDKTNYDWWVWLEAYLKYPYLEQLEKAGYSNLCHDLVINGRKAGFLNFRAKNPAGFVRCGNKRVKARLREFIRINKSADIGDIEDAKELFETREDLSPELVVLKDLHKKARIYKDLPQFSSRRIYNYLEKLNSRELGIYRDYLEMAKQTGTDLLKKQTAFPKNLKAEHDRLVARINAAKTAKNEKEVEERYMRLCESGIVGYTFGGLTVLAPAHAIDIIVEGQCQNNCVGSYLKDHALGKTSIFFIRRADRADESFFTLELSLPKKKGETAEIEQCYGYGNKESYEENLRVSRFLEKYIKHISYCLEHEKEAKKYHRRKMLS